jgi:hypothetical protein
MDILSTFCYGTCQKAIKDSVSRNESEIQNLEASIIDIQKHENTDVDAWREFEAQQIERLQKEIDGIKSNTDHLVNTRKSMSQYEQDPIEEKIKSLKRKNELLLATIAPISKLPSELLSLIFEEFVLMDQSIWPLTNVSSRWKQVAFGTHSIWSRILLMKRDQYGAYSEFRDEGDIKYYKGSSHVCFDDQDFSEAILRAGACPLELSIDYDSWRNDGHNDFVSSLKVAMKKGVANRIKYLDISVKCHPVSTQWPGCFQSMPLENLCCLKIQHLPNEWRQNLFQSISLFTKALRSFTNSKSGPMLTLPDRLWNGMKHLDFNENITSDELDRLCHKVPYIVSLQGLPKEWPSDKTPICTFRDLQSVKLHSKSVNFRRAQWPGVQQMEVTDDYLTSSISNESLKWATFPMLTSLKITSGRPYQWLVRTNMPVLTTLSIETLGFASPDGYQSLPASNFPMLRTVIINVDYGVACGTSLLRALPQVTSLTSKSTGSGVLTLLQRLTEFNGGFTYCPNLQELQIGCADAGTYCRKNSLKAAIKRLINARKKQSYMIRSLLVFWRSSGDAEQYVVG